MKPGESCYGVSMVRMKSQWYTLVSCPLPLLKYLRPFNSTTCFMGFPGFAPSCTPLETNLVLETSPAPFGVPKPSF